MKIFVKVKNPNLLLKTDDINIAIASLLRYKEAQESINSHSATWSVYNNNITDKNCKDLINEEKGEGPKRNDTDINSGVKTKKKKVCNPSVWTAEEDQLLIDNINKIPRDVVKLFTDGRHTEMAIRTRLSAMRTLDKKRMTASVYEKLKVMHDSGQIITVKKPLKKDLQFGV